MGVEAVYFGVAPLDYGVGCSFISYNDEIRLCCFSDEATVPDVQKLVDHVHTALVQFSAGSESV